MDGENDMDIFLFLFVSKFLEWFIFLCIFVYKRLVLSVFGEKCEIIVFSVFCCIKLLFCIFLFEL